MMEMALEAKFKEARENLDKLIISYGLSGEDILLQMYREIASMEIDEKRRLRLIETIGEFNFRLVQGANERIQLEALLARFGAMKE